MVKLTGNKCRCGACKRVFKSVSGFDKHRTGTHGVDRRCLTDDEMIAKGMVYRDTGWIGSEFDRSSFA